MSDLPDRPVTRVERYLAAIAGQDAALPEKPVTRLEQYLAYIAENGAGGGETQPDWNENDENSAAFIRNKPFGRQSFSVSWDGDTEGLEKIELDSMVFWVFSDAPPSTGAVNIAATISTAAGAVTLPGGIRPGGGYADIYMTFGGQTLTPFLCTYGDSPALACIDLAMASAVMGAEITSVTLTWDEVQTLDAVYIPEAAMFINLAKYGVDWDSDAGAMTEDEVQAILAAAAKGTVIYVRGENLTVQAAAIIGLTKGGQFTNVTIRCCAVAGIEYLPTQPYVYIEKGDSGAWSVRATASELLLILTSENGARFRLIVDDEGNLSTEAAT